MPKKFDRILSDDWLPLEFTSGNDVPVTTLMVNLKTLKSVIEQTEQAVLAKLAAQEPVWWVGIDTATGRDYPTSCKSDAEDMASIERFVVTPLYAREYRRLQDIHAISQVSQQLCC